MNTIRSSNQLHSCSTMKRQCSAWFLIAAVLATWGRITMASAAQEPVFTAITDSPISEDYAFSVAWGDHDGDGFIDLLALDFYTSSPGFARIYLFRNQGDGTFNKMIIDRAVYTHSGWLSGATWSDYDNDGRPDVFVTGGGVWAGANPHILLHQESNGSFTRSASPAVPPSLGPPTIWGDFDHDGWLDLFVAYLTFSDTPDVTDILYRNNGDLSFTDANSSGIDQLNNLDNSPMAAVSGDFNGDGLTDIIVTAFRPGNSRIYINKGNLSFDRVFVTPSAPYYDNHANGLAAADYDNDGDLDFITVSKSGDYAWTCACDGVLEGRTKLWRNNGLGQFEQVVSGDLGTDDSIGADAVAWADYNNDGWLDVVLFRGVYGDGRGHDPADVLYRNNGDGTFTRVLTGPIANEIGDARAGAWGDIDNDGDMDLVVANYNWFAPAGSNVRPVLYRNEGNGNNWLKLKLTGTQSNRDAIGAKIRVRATIGGEELWQLRELRTNTGLIPSQNDMRPHFGLGDATVAELVRIEWPSGAVQELTYVESGQILQVVEPLHLRMESNYLLGWPAPAVDFRLECAPSVDGPWSEASETVERNGNQMTAAVTPGDLTKFYRLRR